MGKKSPIHTVDVETIERINVIIQAVIDQTGLINAFGVQSLGRRANTWLRAELEGKTDYGQ